ncbi:transcription initiation factor IIF, beta subunit-domain-containing protein [Cerioporus squamosus]|nr:transcription initiation factor IIF, beta subunit-domain-containing protein [Cerioporus squamosus]
MFRLPKDQVLDTLFQLFEREEHWSMKRLRHETEQPEAYLKEILSDIAMFLTSGEQLRLRSRARTMFAGGEEHGNCFPTSETVEADLADDSRYGAPGKDGDITDDDDEDMEQIVS